MKKGLWSFRSDVTSASYFDVSFDLGCMFVTALKHLISRPYIPPSHIRYLNLNLKNWFTIVSQRRTENKGISILLLVDTNITNNLITILTCRPSLAMQIIQWQNSRYILIRTCVLPSKLQTSLLNELTYSYMTMLHTNMQIAVLFFTYFVFGINI
jgi:hypothetical protein